MTNPELFKYDVRIRERLLRQGLVTEADVKKHLESLADAEAKCETLSQHQPALGYGDEEEDDDDEEAS
ncbi:MAG: hypothetical protein IT377_04810 [Polyangiaceae bacterium]|nr:hypothetical protein [Polyangiaceae bacterium]